MKLSKLFLITGLGAMFLLIGITNTFAQEKKVSEKDLPTAVLNSFHKTYPKAEIKGLSTETEKGSKYFEIESVDGTIKRDLLFTKAGKIVEIEETIPSSDLPKGSLQAIEEKIPGAKVDRAEKVTSGSKVTYELSVAGKSAKYEVVLNKKGKIIKSKKVNSEEGDED